MIVKEIVKAREDRGRDRCCLQAALQRSWADFALVSNAPFLFHFHSQSNVVRVYTTRTYRCFQCKQPNYYHIFSLFINFIYSFLNRLKIFTMTSYSTAKSTFLFISIILFVISITPVNSFKHIFAKGKILVYDKEEATFYQTSSY